MPIVGSRHAHLVLLALALAASLALSACSGVGHQPTATAAQASGDPPLYTSVTVVGSRGEGVLRVPEAIAVAHDGEVYVADQFSHLVQRFSASGQFLGEWGSGGRGPGEFGTIGALAIGGNGDVYVLDSSNADIQVFDPYGNFIRAWGGRGHALGQFEFGPGGGPDIPPGGGLAVHGRFVYVSDTDNGRIQRFHLDGSHAELFGDVHLNRPRGIAVTSTAVYVADDGHARLLQLDRHGRLVRVYQPSGPHALTDPYGVATGPGRVYVVDDNGGRVIALTRRLRWLGQITGAGSSRLSSFLRGVAVDHAGQVYVTDTGNNRVEEFDLGGHTLATWGISGDAGGQLTRPLDVAAAPGDEFLVVGTYGSRSPIYVFHSPQSLVATWQRGGGRVIGRHWFSPTAAAIAPDGSVWVTDQENNIVRHLSPSGGFIAAIGVPSGGHGRGHLEQPRGVALGPGGDVYVADTGNARIARFTPSGRPIGTFTGRGVLREPVAIAVTPSGHLYIADAGDGRVVELNPGGGVLRVWGPFAHPDGIAVDSHGTIFVADGSANRIYEFVPPAGHLRGTIGTGTLALDHPEGLAIDCYGDLLVTDSLNNRIDILHGAAAPAPGCPA